MNIFKEFKLDTKLPLKLCSKIKKKDLNMFAFSTMLVLGYIYYNLCDEKIVLIPLAISTIICVYKIMSFAYDKFEQWQENRNYKPVNNVINVSKYPGDKSKRM